MSTSSSPGVVDTIPNSCIRDEQTDSYVDLEEENGLWPTLCTFVALFLLTLLYSGFVTFIKGSLAGEVDQDNRILQLQRKVLSLNMKPTERMPSMQREAPSPPLSPHSPPSLPDSKCLSSSAIGKEGVLLTQSYSSLFPFSLQVPIIP